jgi:hypothetical protein
MPDLFRFPAVNLRWADDEQGLRLIARGGDLAARLLLLDIAETEFLAGNHAGAAHLLHATFYLEDRMSYELCPPPSPSSLPAAFFMGETYAWQAARCLGVLDV